MTQPDTPLADSKPVNNAESPPALEKSPDAVPKPKNAAPTAATNIRYKFVNVRKADGTIVTVKRPIKQETVTTGSSSNSKVTTTTTTTTTNKLPASTQQTTTSVAQKSEKSEKESLATSPAKSPSPVSTPAKIEPEPPSKTVKQSTSTSHQESSVITTDRQSKISESTSKVSKGISKLRHAPFKLATKLVHAIDGDSDTNGDDDDDDDADGKSDNFGSDSGESGQETDSEPDGKRGETKQTDIGKTASKAVRYTAKEPIVSEKKLKDGDVERDATLTTALDEKEAKPLKERYKDWSRYLIWSSMITFPVLFIVVGLLIAFINGKPSQSREAVAIQNALQVAVSVWPVTFAAIVAQSLRTYATYKVERGLRLMTLEQLLNGHSLASSIKQPFLFRSFNWVTLALLVLWGFSPLATQAMQRVSSTDSYSDKNTTGYWGYMNTTTGFNSLSLDYDDFSTAQPDMNRLYQTAFLADNTFGEDMFDNALIPVLPTSVLSSDQNWTVIDPNSNNNYTSLYGLPVAFPNSDSEYESSSSDLNPTFTIIAKAGYLTFNCSELNTTTMEDSGYMFLNDISSGGNIQTLYVAMTPMEGTTQGGMAFASLITRNTTDPEAFVSIDMKNPNYTDTYAYTYCNFKQTFVDVNISCTDSDCFAAAVRPSAGSHLYMFSGNQTDQGFMAAAGAGSTTNGVATDTERFIMNGYVIGTNTTVDLTAISHADFTTRMSVLLNTYWQIGFGPTHFADSLSNKTADITLSYDEGLRIDQIPMCTTSWGWFAALMVSSVFLLLASISSIIWDARSISPNVLGFASSVLKESNHIRLHDMPADMPHVRPSAGVRELVRKLGNVVVVMQDTKPEDPVGRIELGADHPGVKKLEVGRGYY